MNISIVTLGVVFLLIAFRQIGGGRLKIWQIMLGGAAVVVLTGEITPRAALQAINLDVLFFLLGMFVIGQAAEDSGYLTHLGNKFFGRVKSVDGLVLAILGTMGLGSAVLMNDTVAIIGTPVMLLLARQNNIPARLLLLGLAFAVTIGSVASPIGNPQNLLIAMGGQLPNPFVTFLQYLFVPTVINIFAAYFLLKLLYKNEFGKTNIQPGREEIKHFRLARTARISLILVAGLVLAKVVLDLAKHFVALDCDFKLTYIALTGCAPVLIYRFMLKKKKYRFHILRKIDWFTLVFFAALFVLMASVWQSGFFQQIMAGLALDMTNTAVIMTVAAVLSQLVSNVPLVALFMPLAVSAGAGSRELMALAAGSTIAGNLFILGAASNIIIIQHAEKEANGATLTFGEFARAGLPLTVINILVYWLYFQLV